MRKRIFVIASLLIFSMGLSGCEKKEITKEEVKASETYQDLKIKMDKLQADYDDLKEKMNDVKNESPSEIENNEYQTKLTRGGVFKFDIQLADEEGEKKSFDSKKELALMNIYMNRADCDTNIYTESMEDRYQKLYRYVLYDEDNSVYEMTVYDEDYVIFDDLPQKVFYSKGISSFGIAYYGSKSYQPKVPVMASLYQSALFYVDDELMEKEKARNIIVAFDSLTKKKKKQLEVNADDLKKTLEGRLFGKIYKMQIYKKAIVITDNQGKTEYYKVSSDNCKAFLKNFEN